MKICHIITRMIVGGAQENTLFSAQGAHEAGHEVVLVTGPSPGPEGKLLQQGTAPEFLITECPYLVREIDPVNDLKAYFFLRSYLKKEKFDVVHTHSSKAGIIGRLAAKAAGVPLIVHTIHGLPFHRNEKPWKNKLYIALEKLGAKNCHKIYAVAQAMIDQSLAEGIGTPDQYKVVYSGMELDPFLHHTRSGELRKKLGIPEDAAVIGTVARLFPLKGYETLFQIAPALCKANPKLHFLFVGNGSMREELEQQAEKDGIRDRMSFAGLVPPQEVYQYIAQMDILVHLSLREGLPRAVVQALASGVPAVGFALDGTPEVIHDGETGFLVDPEHPEASQEALQKLLDDPEKRLRMGNAGRELVKDLFPWRRMSGILLEEYAKNRK